MSDDGDVGIRRRLAPRWIRPRRASAVIVVAGLLTSALIAAYVSRDRHPRTVAGSAGSALHVQGTTLTRAGGRRFLAAGATDYLVPFYLGDDGGPDPSVGRYAQHSFDNRDAAFRRMRDAGMNVVRVPLGLSSYLKDAYGLGGKAGYLKRVRAIADSARRAHLVVLFGWWDDTYRPGQGWSPDLYAMMRDVVDTLHSRSGVMFEPVNEPRVDDWAPWRHDMPAMVRFWRQDLAYRGVLLIDTPGFSWTFDPASAHDLQTLDAGLLKRPSQLVFANHRYANANTCFCGDERTEWARDIEAYAGRFPLLGTEYGWADTPYTVQLGWNEQFFAYIAASAVPRGFNGALAFVWDWVDDNTMTNADGLTFNARGRVFQEDFLSRVNTSR